MSIVKGNDELAYWLRSAATSDKPEEIRIAVDLSCQTCPNCPCKFYESRYPDDDIKWSFKEMLEHFKLMHYSTESKRRRAVTIIKQQIIEIVKNEPPPRYVSMTKYIDNLWRIYGDEYHIVRLEDKLDTDHTEKDSLVYGILQQLVVYESTGKSTKRFNADKRALVIYKLSKDYGIPIQLIGYILGSPLKAKNVIPMLHRGMMLSYGNKVENLPQWMQNALSNPVSE